MGTQRRIIWILALAAFTVMASGCARTSFRSVEDEITRGGTGITKERGQSVRGYLLTDDTMVEYEGMVHVTGQDSLAFWSEGRSEEATHQGLRKEIRIPGPVYPFSAIKALNVYEARNGRTGILAITGLFVGLLVIGMATWDGPMGDG